MWEPEYKDADFDSQSDADRYDRAAVGHNALSQRYGLAAGVWSGDIPFAKSIYYDFQGWKRQDHQVQYEAADTAGRFRSESNVHFAGAEIAILQCQYGDAGQCAT